MKPLKVADIFSGCGGFIAGFAKEIGFQPSFAVDLNGVALATLKRNLPSIDCVEADLSKSSEINRLSRLMSGVDVMLGGPPCQGFSTLGKRRDGDRRSTLVDVFADLVQLVSPQIVLVENVKGITTKRHPHYPTYSEALAMRLDAAGYECSSEVLNARDYGVPQNRIRWFMIGIRKDVPRSKVALDMFWNKVKLDQSKGVATVADAMGDLPAVRAGEAAEAFADGTPLYNHRAMNHSSALLSRLECIPANGGLPDVPRHLLTPHLRKMIDGGYGSGGHVKNIYGRLAWEQPSGTVVAGIDKITCGRFVHPDQDRLITPRECARLQSFDDEYIFEGGQVAQYYQIGNAVPPHLAHVLAKAILSISSTLVSNAGISKNRVELAA